MDLAERLPLVVAKNMALLRPHLDGEAYAVRNAIVAAMGHCVVAYSAPLGEDDSPAAKEGRLVAKQACRPHSRAARAHVGHVG